jgi:hypothetical protein
MDAYEGGELERGCYAGSAVQTAECGDSGASGSTSSEPDYQGPLRMFSESYASLASPCASLYLKALSHAGETLVAREPLEAESEAQTPTGCVGKTKTVSGGA